MYCYFIIWGVGIEVKNELFEEINSASNFEILTILEHKPKNVKDFIKGVYCYEYLPFTHHETKFEHLNKTTSEVVIIFAINHNPKCEYWGDQSKKFIHSRSIKEFKVSIREKYDPRINGKLTHEHVIHASDNETQVHHFLKFLGVEGGLKHFEKEASTLKTPWFIENFNEFSLKRIPTSQLYGNIITEKNRKTTKVLTELTHTPHFKYLMGNRAAFENYVTKYSNNQLLGGPLYWKYSIEKFEKLSKNFKYLQEPFTQDIIVVRRIEDKKFLILDGLHRASIIKHQGHSICLVAIVK